MLYFRKSRDGVKVDNALTSLKIRAEEVRSEGDYKNFTSNVVTCSDDVNIDAVRVLALALYDSGVRYGLSRSIPIRPFLAST